MDWNNGRPNLPTGFSGNFASSCPSPSKMKPPMPLSKSASALQTISVPCSSFVETRTSNGAGGGVVSLVAPVFTNSIHAFATASFGNQTASAGLPLKSAAGFASSMNNGASHALLVSIGLSVCSLLPLSGNRIARQASRNGMQRSHHIGPDATAGMTPERPRNFVDFCMAGLDGKFAERLEKSFLRTITRIEPQFRRARRRVDLLVLHVVTGTPERAVPLLR